MKDMKCKIGLMTASIPLMSYLCCTSVIAGIAEAFPDAPIQIVQMLTYAANLTCMISSILISKLTPYFYKKTLMLVTGLFFPIAGLIIYFFHPNVVFILIITFLMGIGSGARVTCIPTLICDCFEGKTANRLMGLQGAFISCGAMIFTWLGSVLGNGKWERSYLALLLVLVALLIEFICLPNGKLELKKEASTSPEATKVPLSVILYTIVTWFSGIFVAVFNSNISLLVELRNVGSTVQAGYASSIYSFAGIFAGILTGYIISRTRQRIFLIAIGIGFAGMILTFVGHSLPLLCIGGALCGMAFSGMTPAGNIFAAEDSNEYNRALCVALFNAGNGCGLLVSSLIFGMFLGNLPMETRIPATFLSAAIGYAVLFVAMLLIIYVVLKLRFPKRQKA